MKQLFLPLEQSNKPKYQLLADAFRSAIREGLLRPGEVLPSTRSMADTYKMNRHTVMNALGTLESEGWIEAFEKKHYLVTSALPDTFLLPPKKIHHQFAGPDVNYRFARTIGIGEYVSDRQCKYAFLSGFPDIRLFPMKEFKSALYDSLKATDLLDYGDPAGLPQLRNEVAHYLRRIRNIDKRTIVITNGSQEAIFLLAQLFIKPGDAVAVEALGYPPAIEALKFAGAKIVPIKIDQEGMDVEDLEKKMKLHKIKLIYTTPLHQYPTTITLSASRRLRLYEIALKNKSFILEDDYDHEFHYDSNPVAPLASFDPAGIVLYVSTFSKILFPSARVGFMAVPLKIGNEIAKLKRISSRQNEHLLQASIANWLASGEFEKHLRKMRRTYHERRDALIGDLEHFQKKHPELTWASPDGGMAIWIDMKTNSSLIAEKARKLSIYVTPEKNFRLDGKDGTNLRLGFTGQTCEENRKGLEKLFSLLQ
ncbi:MAG: MocR-like pyridoxine biosynthesis transcription factor PdxR [Bacteriovorax sp.]